MAIIPFRREANGAQAAQAQTARARAIRERLKEHPGGFRKEIPGAAAELYHIITDRGEEFRTRLCRYVFGNESKYPTKRLWGVVWDPAGKQPVAKLRQRATIYVRLSDGIADLTGASKDEMLLRLFPGIETDPARLSHSPAGGSRDELRDQLWTAWAGATDLIAKDLDLRRVLRAVMEYPREQSLNVFKLDYWEVYGGLTDGASRLSPLAIYAYFPSPWTYVKMLPQLFLGECKVRTLRARVETRREDGKRPVRLPKRASWVSVWLQFWWAILPIGSSGEPRGCFLATLRTTRPKGDFAADLWSEYVETQIEAPARPLPWTSLLKSEYGEPNPLDFSYFQADSNARGLRLEWDAWSEDHKARIHCVAEPDEVLQQVIRSVFGCDPAQLPENPMRILPAVPEWRDAIFTLIDGSSADWVGPDPDEPGILMPKAPAENDFETDEAYQEAEDSFSDLLRDWEDREKDYRHRFEDWRDDATPLAYTTDWTKLDISIGLKLELSLLRLPETDRPDIRLRRQAQALADRANEVLSKTLESRQAQLAALGRPAAIDQSPAEQS